MDRYDASGNIEAQFEPGSDGRVLRNLLSICDPAEMDHLELTQLTRLYMAIPDWLRADQVLSVADLMEWHRLWLKTIYPWAGQIRTVNLSKGNLTFAAVRQLPYLLDELDTKILPAHTPCAGMDEDRLAEAIGIVHVELILVHPFREGNGRIARFVAHVMALQAGRAALNFSPWDADREGYFAAIHAGLSDYGPIKRLVKIALGASASQ